jgi:shikimate dehydrogenase
MSFNVSPKAFVAGWPIAHSRSPIIHGYWLKQLSLAGSYEAVAVAPPDFPEFVRHLAESGFCGGNVTLPHKRKAYELCDQLTPTAAKLGAVNTIWRQDGTLCGDNTDVAGFLSALDEDMPGWDAPAGPAVVLGAGGAASAVVFALWQRGKRIVLANRTKARAETIAARFSANVDVIDWARLPKSLEEAAILINATSLGMKGHPPLEIDISRLPEEAVVNDIVYFPLETALLRAARLRKLRAASGVGMLLHQAAPGFQRWFGVEPRVDDDLRHLVEADVLMSI